MILGGQPPGKVGRSQLEKALENISGAFFIHNFILLKFFLKKYNNN